MNQELRDKWIAALRSGEYKQGEGALFRDGCYCCLGVLACVAGHGTEDIVGHTTLSGFGHLELLSNDELPEAGALEEVLWMMNDRGVSFDVIANWIAENVPAEA